MRTVDLTLTYVSETVTTSRPTDMTIRPQILGFGPRGPRGVAGVGIPDGGSTSQVLTKLSDTNGDAGWLESAEATDASPTTKGIVQLAGDLSGTATSPTVPGLASKEPTISAGTSAQYYRGDKSWQTLNQDAVPDGSTNKVYSALDKTRLASTSGSNTGDQDLSGLVPNTRTVNGHALSSNVTVTKSDVSLGNVDNTSDLNKPVSTAQQTALNAKANTTYVDTQDALNEKLANKNTANGYAGLDGTGKVAAAQLPSYVDDVLEYANLAALPGIGETGKIYVTLDTNFEYRWGGSSYVRIVASPGTTDALTEGSTNLYFTNARASAAAPVQSVAGRTGTVTLAKSDVGLSNVDNTSDVSKPISTATQSALDLKAPLASPALTGTPTTPTAAPGTSSTQIASTAFVETEISGAATPDATTSVKGKIQLAGDLAGTASAPTTKSRSVKATVGPAGSVSDYVCTGTDDDVTIKSAITAVNSAGGGTVLIRAGSYNLMHPINLSGITNVVIRGDVMGTTFVIPQASLSNFSFGRMITTDSTSSDITIEGITFNGGYSGYTSPPANQGGGIYPGLRWTIQNCVIKDFNYFGLYLGINSIDVKILNNIFDGPGSGNDHIGGGGGTYIEIAHNIFTAAIAGNMFDNTTGSYFNIHHNTNHSSRSVYLESLLYVNFHHNNMTAGGNVVAQSDISYGHATVTNSRYVQIKDNTLNGGKIQYTCATSPTVTTSVGGDVQISGNTILNAPDCGILVIAGADDNTIWGSGYAIQGNLVKNPNSSNAATFVTGYGTVHPSAINFARGMHALITDNICVDDLGTHKMLYGIEIGQTSSPSALTEPDYVYLAGNTTDGYVTGSVNVVSTTYTTHYGEITGDLANGVRMRGNYMLNKPTTADTNAQLMVTSPSATSKPLVLQANSGQSANLIELQSSAGGIFLNITSGGLVRGPTSSAASPTYSFSVEGGTGMYRPAGTANTLRFSVAANDRLQLNANGATFYNGMTYNRTAVGNVSYTALVTDFLIEYTSLSATRTVTLPTAVGVAGQMYLIKDATNSAASNNIVIATTSSQTIDGASSYTITVNNGYVTLYSNGSNWQTAGFTGVTSVAGRTGAITLAESDITNLTTDLAAKATDSLVVHTAGTETVTGDKTFTGLTTITGLPANDLRYATQLTGSNGSNVSLGVKTYIDGTPFTFGTWIDFYRNDLADDSGIWGYGYSLGNNAGYFARLDGTTKKLTFFYGSTQVTTSNTYCYGRMWLVLTYDGATTLKVYKNNILMDTLTIAARNADVAAGSYLGTRDGTGRNLNGSLDDSFLYSRVLTSTEMTAIYRTAIFPSSSNKFLYHFDERTGTTATDSSGSSNTGTINSGTYLVSEFGNPNHTPSVASTFQAALSGADITHTSAVFLGSSTTQGSNATTIDNRYTDVLGRLLHKSFDDPSVIGGKHIRAADTGWSTSGTTSLNGDGLGLGSYSLSAAATLSRTLTNCTGFDLHFVQGPGQGTFTVQVDGGSAVTVTPNTTGTANRHDGTYTITGLTRGSHTIQVNATNACIINGIYVQDGDSTTGIRIYNSGKGGFATSDFIATAGATIWTRLAAIADVSLVAMMFSSNDFSASIDPATFKANLYTLIHNAWTTLPIKADIVLINSYKRFDQVTFGTVYLYNQYATQLQALANELDGVYYVDISSYFPLVNDSSHDPLDLMNTDNIHMNDSGHRFMARALVQGLAPTVGHIQTDTTIRANDSLVVHNTGNETVAGVKTFSSAPVISTITNTGTLTLPTSTDTLVGRATTDTLTGKRVTKRTATTTSSATPAINTDNLDGYSITALAAAITSFTTNLTGTPTDKQTLWIDITDDGTARSITWGPSFEASTIALPTTTVVSTRLDAGFVWNTVTSKWRIIAAA